jgi:hypothetical protein
MIARTLLLLTVAPLAALAQLQVYAVSTPSCATPISSGLTLTAVGSSYPVGSAALGDTIYTQFQVENPGSQLVDVEISLAGEGFSIAAGAAPSLGPGLEETFCVAFTPTIFGSYSAILQVNDLPPITLTGSAAASATLTVSGTTAPLTSGATVPFGSVVIGQTQTQTFTLFNSYGSTLTVNSVAVSGAGFSGPAGASFPLQIGPGQNQKFQVTFAPLKASGYQGTLTIDGQAFTLQGLGLDPPLPSASIVLASTVGASGQQNSITIPLSAASQVSGSGTLAMSFQSSVAGVSDDPSIGFLSGALRQASVTIVPGSPVAMIDGQQNIAFQTGATAGTITFTLALENGSQETSLTIPPLAVVVESENAVRELNAIAVSFDAFDNTYSASQLAFTFYDINGNALPQGAINVDASADFQPYFNTTQSGGSFALLATFPVTGNTVQIGFVTVQITNSLGSTTTEQIQILN